MDIWRFFSGDTGNEAQGKFKLTLPKKSEEN